MRAGEAAAFHGKEKHIVRAAEVARFGKVGVPHRDRCDPEARTRVHSGFATEYVSLDRLELELDDLAVDFTPRRDSLGGRECVGGEMK
jgi:hypothetical protein